MDSVPRAPIGDERDHTRSFGQLPIFKSATVQPMTAQPLDVELLHRRDPRMTRRFLNALRFFARRYFHRRSDIDHVALDALAELLSKLDGGEQPTSVTQWIVTAASNATKRRLTYVRHAPIPSTSFVFATAERGTPSAAFGAREQLHRVAEVLARMPDNTREAVIATTVEGRHTGSIARELGMKPGTLRKELSRARDVIRRELSADEKLDLLRILAHERRLSQGIEPPRIRRSADDSSTTT